MLAFGTLEPRKLLAGDFFRPTPIQTVENHAIEVPMVQFDVSAQQQTQQPVLEFDLGNGSAPIVLSGDQLEIVQADDGSATLSPAQPLTVNYTDDGDFSLVASVRLDGGSGQVVEYATRNVYVANAAPQVQWADGFGQFAQIHVNETYENVTSYDVTQATPVSEGETFSFSIEITDHSPDDTFTAVLDLGDGSAPLQLVETSAIRDQSGSRITFTAAAPISYADDGLYAASVTVTDDDGGSQKFRIAADIANVAPVVSINASDTTVDAREMVAIQLSGQDVATDTIGQWVVDWGDGNTELLDGQTASAAHAFRDPGKYAIAVRAIDEDGSTEDYLISIDVRDPVTGLVPAAATGPQIEFDLPARIAVQSGSVWKQKIDLNLRELNAANVTVELSAASAAIPELSIQNSPLTGQQVLHWDTPTASGTHAITLTATDSITGTTTQATLTVMLVADVAALDDAVTRFLNDAHQQAGQLGDRLQSGAADLFLGGGANQLPGGNDAVANDDPDQIDDSGSTDTTPPPTDPDENDPADGNDGYSHGYGYNHGYGYGHGYAGPHGYDGGYYGGYADGYDPGDAGDASGQYIDDNTNTQPTAPEITDDVGYGHAHHYMGHGHHYASHTTDDTTANDQTGSEADGYDANSANTPGNDDDGGYGSYGDYSGYYGNPGYQPGDVQDDDTLSNVNTDGSSDTGAGDGTDATADAEQAEVNLDAPDFKAPSDVAGFEDRINAAATDQPSTTLLDSYAAGSLGIDASSSGLTFTSQSLGDEANLVFVERTDIVHTVESTNYATVVGRHLFYNNSAWDQSSDSDAIAGDRQALLEGSAASTANVSSYDKGINGIIIDVSQTASSISASDLEFRVGSDVTYTSGGSAVNWQLAPVPTSVTFTAGTGVGGTDRVVVTFADGAIANQWLQVRIKANGNTHLQRDDIFYFGSSVGDTLGDAGNVMVDGRDASRIAANFTASADGFFGDNAAPSINDRFDINRDGTVDQADQQIALNNQTDISTPGSMVGLIDLTDTFTARGTSAGDGSGQREVFSVSVIREVYLASDAQLADFELTSEVSSLDGPAFAATLSSSNFWFQANGDNTLVSHGGDYTASVGGDFAVGNRPNVAEPADTGGDGAGQAGFAATDDASVRQTQTASKFSGSNFQFVHRDGSGNLIGQLTTGTTNRSTTSTQSRDTQTDSQTNATEATTDELGDSIQSGVSTTIESKSEQSSIESSSSVSGSTTHTVSITVDPVTGQQTVISDRMSTGSYASATTEQSSSTESQNESYQRDETPDATASDPTTGKVIAAPLPTVTDPLTGEVVAAPEGDPATGSGESDFVLPAEGIISSSKQTDTQAAGQSQHSRSGNFQNHFRSVRTGDHVSATLSLNASDNGNQSDSGESTSTKTVTREEATAEGVLTTTVTATATVGLSGSVAGNDARNATLSGSNHAAGDLSDGDAAGPMASSSTSTDSTTSSPGDFVVSGGLSNTATLTNLSNGFSGELETDSDSTYRFDGGVATSLTTYRGNTGDNSNLDGPASTRDQLNLESDQATASQKSSGGTRGRSSDNSQTTSHDTLNYHKTTTDDAGNVITVIVKTDSKGDRTGSSQGTDSLSGSATEQATFNIASPGLATTVAPDAAGDGTSASSTDDTSAASNGSDLGSWTQGNDESFTAAVPTATGSGNSEGTYFRSVQVNYADGESRWFESILLEHGGAGTSSGDASAGGGDNTQREIGLATNTRTFRAGDSGNLSGGGKTTVTKKEDGYWVQRTDMTDIPPGMIEDVTTFTTFISEEKTQIDSKDGGDYGSQADENLTSTAVRNGQSAPNVDQPTTGSEISGDETLRSFTGGGSANSASSFTASATPKTERSFEHTVEVVGELVTVKTVTEDSFKSDVTKSEDVITDTRDIQTTYSSNGIGSLTNGTLKVKSTSHAEISNPKRIFTSTTSTAGEYRQHGETEIDPGDYTVNYDNVATVTSTYDAVQTLHDLDGNLKEQSGKLTVVTHEVGAEEKKLTKETKAFDDSRGRYISSSIDYDDDRRAKDIFVHTSGWDLTDTSESELKPDGTDTKLTIAGYRESKVTHDTEGEFHKNGLHEDYGTGTKHDGTYHSQSVVNSRIERSGVKISSLALDSETETESIDSDTRKLTGHADGDANFSSEATGYQKVDRLKEESTTNSTHNLTSSDTFVRDWVSAPESSSVQSSEVAQSSGSNSSSNFYTTHAYFPEVNAYDNTINQPLGHSGSYQVDSLASLNTNRSFGKHSRGDHIVVRSGIDIRDAPTQADSSMPSEGSSSEPIVISNNPTQEQYDQLLADGLISRHEGWGTDYFLVVANGRKYVYQEHTFSGTGTFLKSFDANISDKDAFEQTFDNTISSTGTYAGAVGQGLVTSGKAAVNTVVRTGTLGMVDQAVTVTEHDLGYAGATVGFELAVALTPAGLAKKAELSMKVARATKILNGVDTAQSFVSTGRGAYGVFRDGGLNWNNGTQLVGGLLGVAGSGVFKKVTAPKDGGLHFTNGGGCFVAGTLVHVLSREISEPRLLTIGAPRDISAQLNPHLKKVAIEEVELGSLLDVNNPEESGYDPFLTFSGELVELGLKIVRADRSEVWAKILRPAEQTEHLRIGDQLPVRSDELEVSGLATVEDKRPFGRLPTDVSATSVVTGRFITPVVTETTRVHLDDGSVLEGTPIHPVWVVERQEFVPLGELRVGDRLDANEGTATIESIATHRSPKTVYNLEASGQHVYRIGPDGILVHNSGGPCTPLVQINAPNRTVDFVDDLDDVADRLHAVGGEAYGAQRLAKLESYLAKRGVKLEVGSPDLLPGKAGSFIADASDGTARLLLKADPSKQLVWHELGHFLQWKKVGAEAFSKLSRTFGNNVPEQFVFDLLEKPSRWGRLTASYRDHMIDYITRVWGGVGR